MWEGHSKRKFIACYLKKGCSFNLLKKDVKWVMSDASDVDFSALKKVIYIAVARFWFTIWSTHWCIILCSIVSWFCRIVRLRLRAESWMLQKIVILLMRKRWWLYSIVFGMASLSTWNKLVVWTKTWQIHISKLNEAGSEVGQMEGVCFRKKLKSWWEGIKMVVIERFSMCGIFIADPTLCSSKIAAELF